MFRHLVVTGRSRLALYLARIPAGWQSSCPWSQSDSPLSARCASSRLRRRELRRCECACRPFACRIRELAANHSDWSCATSATTDRVCRTSLADLTARSSKYSRVPRSDAAHASPAPNRSHPGSRQNYSSYASDFLYPSDSLMIRSGLWLELEALIGLLVGLDSPPCLGRGLSL